MIGRLNGRSEHEPAYGAAAAGTKRKTAERPPASAGARRQEAPSAPAICGARSHSAMTMKASMKAKVATA